MTALATATDSLISKSIDVGTNFERSLSQVIATMGKTNVDLNNCYVDFLSTIKSAGLNGYAKTSEVDTPNYHYDVNNDGTVDNQDLTALQDYLGKGKN